MPASLITDCMLRISSTVLIWIKCINTRFRLSIYDLYWYCRGVKSEQINVDTILYRSILALFILLYYLLDLEQYGLFKGPLFIVFSETILFNDKDHVEILLWHISIENYVNKKEETNPFKFELSTELDQWLLFAGN